MEERGQLIRLQHDDGYPSGFTLLDNRDIWTTCDRNRKLVLRPLALGVYAAMRSLPGGWEFREPWLMEHLDMGRDALRRAIRDLEAVNRLTREVKRDAQGRYIRIVWTLHRAGASPLTGFPSPGNPSPEDPTVGKPRCRETRTRVNKERASNTDLALNTESITTTTAPVLIWPHWLDEDKRVVVVEWMDGLNPALHQPLLDEFARKMETDPPGSPMGWLFKTIERACTGKDGGFIPSLGLVVEARRARAAQEAADEEAARVTAAEAEKRKSECQARLDQMSDSAVREMLLSAAPDLKPNRIDDWLKDGRPKSNFVASIARDAIGRRK